MRMRPEGQARKLERSGSLQIVDGKGAADLWPKERFKKPKTRKPRKRQLTPGKGDGKTGRYRRSDLRAEK